MVILQAIGTWLLKIFLSGVFGTANQKLQDQANDNAEAGAEAAQSAHDAAKVEQDILKAQQAAKEHDQSMPHDENDPFGANEWNSRNKP